MTIDIRGVAIARALRAQVIKELTAALGQLAVAPARVLVTFFDDNGPKGGPAMRCALTARLPYRPHVRVEEVAETPRAAFDGSFAKLRREIERGRERSQESKRHPKKYYAAKRLMAATASGGGGEPARTPAQPRTRPDRRRS